jgi:AcrR family transcriptional regulator
MPSTIARPRRHRQEAIEARWRLAPPAQARSRETVDRFAQAAEELLRERPFEEIGVQDIARHAGRPVGSFYARFGSKEALLPFLYQRYHEGLEPLLAARLERVSWPRLGFERTVEAVVDIVIGMYSERRWLIRALALFARMRPEALPPDVVARRRRVYEPLEAVLRRHASSIAHTDADAAIRFGVFLVSSVARERMLFAEAPLARITPIPRADLRRELVRALHSYLAAEAP